MKGKSLTDALHDIQSGNKENYMELSLFTTTLIHHQRK